MCSTVDEANVRHLLHQLGVNVQRATYTGSVKRTRWMNVSCPFARFTHGKGTDQNPSFGITLVDGGRSFYKCLSCGVKGRLASMPTRLGGYRKEDYSKLHHWAEMAELQATIAAPVVDWERQVTEHDQERVGRELPHETIIDTYPRAMGLPYLSQRGVTHPAPLLLNLRYDSFQHRILFPCYDRYDQFNGFTGRSVMADRTYSKQNPKVRDYYGLDKRTLFLRLRGQQTGRKLITEGLIDYAMGVQYGFRNTHAILGTALTPEKIDILISEGDPVYFFMDNDLAGWQALFGVPNDEGDGYETHNAWAFQLYREIPVWIVPYPTPLNTGNLDPGMMSRKSFNNSVKRAWLFTGEAPLDAGGNPHMMPPD